jgi:hypothetical protein
LEKPHYIRSKLTYKLKSQKMEVFIEASANKKPSDPQNEANGKKR